MKPLSRALRARVLAPGCYFLKLDTRESEVSFTVQDAAPADPEAAAAIPKIAQALGVDDFASEIHKEYPDGVPGGAAALPRARAA